MRRADQRRRDAAGNVCVSSSGESDQFLFRAGTNRLTRKVDKKRRGGAAGNVCQAQMNRSVMTHYTLLYFGGLRIRRFCTQWSVC